MRREGKRRKEEGGRGRRYRVEKGSRGERKRKEKEEKRRGGRPW